MTKIKKLTLIVTAVVAAVVGWVGSSGSAYATNTTGASSNQGVATSISNKWVKITTSGNVSMSIVPLAGDGSLAAAKGTVNVKTNSGSGYQLYLSGALYDTSNSNHWAALYKNGNSSTSANIPTTTATSTAAALAVNEWGYAVPSVSGNGYAAADLYQTAVDGENITSTTTMNQLKWKGVKGDYQHIFTSTNTDASMSTTGEDTDVYYGTRVNSSTDIGNYTNTIVYTAFIDGGTSVTMDPIVLPITNEGTSTTVTFETGHESSSNPVTPSQIEVSLFNSADANATVATCDPSTIAIVSGHDGTSGRPLQFTCTVTRNLATSDNNGTLYDVIVRVDKENNGLYMTYEHQDYWRFITQWNYSLTFNGNNATSGVPSNQTGTKLETKSFSYTLPANPTRTYYTFDNWSDGSSTYTSGNTVTLTKSSPSKTLTASWNEISVTYTLNFSDGTQTISANKPSTQTGTKNRSAGQSYSFTIPSTTPTTTAYYNFKHWSDGTNTYAPGATVTLTSTSDTNISVSKTLTAIWERQTFSYTIKYCDNTSTNCTSGLITDTTGTGNVGEATTATLSSSTPTKDGYNFKGWATTSGSSTVSYNAGATNYSLGTPTSTSAITRYLYAVWEVAGWTATINYNANGGSNAPSATTITGIALSTDTQSLTLDTATTPTRSGYTFIGWASAASVPHTTYADGASLTVQQSSPTITVYAEWIANSTTSGGNMQNASCSSLTHGTLYSMTDTRTSKSYLVAKLADGNCWMLQNLYIPNGTTLTSSTSNVSSNYSLPSSSNSTSNWSNDSTAYYYAGTHLDATKDSNVNGGDTTNTGSYFSFIAATAGTGTGSSGNASSSVCPKDWRLPTGGSSGEFKALYTAYSSNASNFNTAFKYNATSYCYTSGCPLSSNAYGFYWSSTIYSSANAYLLSTYASSTSPSYVNSKRNGRSVRCVLAS